MKTLLTRLFAALIPLTTIATLGAYWFVQSILSFPSQTIDTQQLQTLEVKPGTSITRLVHQLEAKGVLTEAWKMKYLVKLEPKWASIQTGLFEVKQNDTFDSLFARINRGQQMSFSVTLIEGQTIKEWRETLKSHPQLQYQQTPFLTVLDEKGDDSGLPEGKFFPETYHFHAGENVTEILSRSYDMMQENLAKAWQGRDKDLRLASPYELLIIASIIEKETGQASERDWVAAVFNNRLIKGMRLQTDPTVIYGMGDRYQGNITRKDLQEHTAFNTYRINGLPPTPIAAPSRASLFAAANPADVDYLYFVSRNDGTHVFSTNLRDHNNAVNKYQRNR